MNEPADQAAQLRARVEASRTSLRLPAIAVTGGKGGVGKTCVAVNLALALAGQGLRPLLVDFDLGLANADVMLGASPKATILDVVNGTHALDAIVNSTPHGIDFVPAASGHDELTRLDERTLQRILSDLGRLAASYDLLVIDTAAGIGREVSMALAASRIVLTVVTPEPTAIADAYALIKVLEQQSPGLDLRLLINQAASGDDATATAARLRKVAKAYLGRDLSVAGWLPRDRHVSDAVRARKPFLLDRASPAAQALRTVAMNLSREGWRR
jgi:flagellar biosynthesis protein FlhG